MTTPPDMREEIVKNLYNPGQLERLYRANQTNFKRAFNLIFPDIQENPAAQVWNERLNFENERISWGTGKELAFVVIGILIAGLIAKLPFFAGIREEFYYPRNIAFIIFPILTVYFAWKQATPAKTLGIAALAILVSAIYINLLPNNDKSDTLILACIHLPIFLWAVLGFTFVGDKLRDHQSRTAFLRFNGDLLVMTAIITIAAGLLTAITVGLFNLIDVPVEKFYSKYLVFWGAPALPIIAAYLVQTNPELVNKVSPVIAKVFTPLVFVTLVIYLAAVLYTGKDPYNDRDFLLIFNLLLIGVMAIILFSIAETAKNRDNKFGVVMLLALSAVTIIVNGIALSAILFRISEWGITPNRLAILGGNVLILMNLLLVTLRLFKTVKNRNDVERVENSIAAFLPVYVLWTIVVTFLFPIIFHFK